MTSSINSLLHLGFLHLSTGVEGLDGFFEEGLDGAVEGLDGAFEGLDGSFEGLDGAFEGLGGSFGEEKQEPIVLGLLKIDGSF